MKHKNILQGLTIKHNFMFGAVMCDENNCRRLLEMILRFPIDRVEISKEKTIVYHPEYKGVRLDIYAKDANNTRYNVEMQSVQQRYTRDFGDPYVQMLQKSVQSVKENRDWEERFMILREMLREERAEGRVEGRAEAIVELLTELGSVSNALLEKIRNESNPELLTKWLKLAARVHSVEQFEENM
ncbi:MAG: hypothetical protein E7293_07950 [Lachnospiraceae bacterium]|nr:hypothetical protein [Lachnospiraceae bacterium]